MIAYNLPLLAWLAVGSVAPFGKAVFIGTLGLLLIWLILIPRHLLGQSESVPAWWRNVRVWAIVVCAIQMWVYWQFA
jgi:hypothetical protein